MTASFHLPPTIYHLPLISHLSFANEELLNANLLKIDNCELNIEHRRCVS